VASGSASAQAVAAAAAAATAEMQAAAEDGKATPPLNMSGAMDGNDGHHRAAVSSFASSGGGMLSLQIVNPDSLPPPAVKRKAMESPSTPWDGQLEALVSQVKSQQQDNSDETNENPQDDHQNGASTTSAVLANGTSTSASNNDDAKKNKGRYIGIVVGTAKAQDPPSAAAAKSPHRTPGGGVPCLHRRCTNRVRYHARIFVVGNERRWWWWCGTSPPESTSRRAR